jgi:hypothetical protein
MLTCQVITRGAQPLVLGYIGCIRVAPLSTYSFTRPSGSLWEPIAEVHEYARWSESAFGLLARLLRLLPLNERPWKYLPQFTCELCLGSSSWSRRIEHLKVQVNSDRLSVELRDELWCHRATALAAGEYADLVDVLLHAARIAVWGADEQPPIPAPLTSIPVHRTSGGVACVFEHDMPPHARRHFLRKQAGVERESLPAGAHRVADWYDFIGA